MTSDVIAEARDTVKAEIERLYRKMTNNEDFTEEDLDINTAEREALHFALRAMHYNETFNGRVWA